MDDMRKDGEEPKDILAKLQRNRARKGSHGPGHATAYNFLAGAAHRRDATESRGRISKMPPRLVSVAARMRKRLTQQANNEYPVAWDDIHAATKTELRRLGLLTRGTKMLSVDWLTRLVRNPIEVRARPPKRRLSRTEKHEQQRYETSGKWRKHAKMFWYNGVHGYFDNSTVCDCSYSHAEEGGAIHTHSPSSALAFRRWFERACCLQEKASAPWCAKC